MILRSLSRRKSPIGARSKNSKNASPTMGIAAEGEYPRMGGTVMVRDLPVRRSDTNPRKLSAPGRAIWTGFSGFPARRSAVILRPDEQGHGGGSCRHRSGGATRRLERLGGSQGDGRLHDDARPRLAGGP